MALAGTAFINFEGDFGGLQREASRAGDRSGGAFSSGFGKKAKGGVLSSFKGLAGAGAAIFAGTKVVSIFGDTITEARDAAKVTRITENAIKTTGGVANVTAGQVGKLAESISNKTGIDDEQIQTASNMLLTFKNIRNESGKGGKIFDRTTQAAADLSVQFGGIDGASKQLGKALNDPVKGISALSKAGVTFSQTQKDQIANFVESGDLLSAQKIILGEVEGQVGGAAEAAADPMQKLSVTVGNLKERVGTALLPVIEKIAGWLGENLPKALDKGSEMFKKIQPIIGRVVTKFHDVVDAVAPFAKRVTDFFKKDPDAKFAALATVIGGVVLAAVVSLAGAVLALFSPVVLVVGAIALLVAGAIYAYKHFEGFRNVVDGVVKWFTTTAIPAFKAFAAVVVEKFGDLVAYVKRIWPQVSEAIGHVMETVKGIIGRVVGTVQLLWDKFGGRIISIIRGAFDFVKNTIGNVMQIVRGIIQTVTSLINGDWGKAWDGIKGILSGVWDQIANIVKFGVAILQNIISGIGETLGAAWDGFWNGLTGVVSSVWNGIIGIIGSAVNTIIDFLNTLNFSFKIPDIPGLPGRGEKYTIGIEGIPHVNWGKAKDGAPQVGGQHAPPKFHQGGIVGGRGEQTITALGGEMVLTAKQQTELYGSAGVPRGGWSPISNKPTAGAGRGRRGDTNIGAVHYHGVADGAERRSMLRETERSFRG